MQNFKVLIQTHYKEIGNLLENLLELANNNKNKHMWLKFERCLPNGE